MKYRLIKALDVTGLSVLEPVVRLLWGEEPRAQLRQIGLFIVVPILVFCTFLVLWDFVGPRHRTKSGEVPTPGVVLDAYRGIAQFHDREYTKLHDFARQGEDRGREIERVEERLAALSVEAAEVTKTFSDLESRFAAELAANLSPCTEAIRRQEELYRAEEARNEARLLSWGETIRTGDVESKAQFLRAAELFLAEKEGHRDHIKALRAELDEKRRRTSPPLEVARQRKNSLEQEAQYLKKRLHYLTGANRSSRVEQASGELAASLTDFKAASGGRSLLDQATRIVQQKDRIDRIQESEYAKPPTFFDQILTSVECVFLGFIIATIIAIPLGVLCGLSPVFMASMTPLISLFKPVSPIVWLPIVFIIVGGFISVPEEAWLPPAFLSSALTVALCCLWPTLVNTALGVASIQQDHLNVARMLRLGFWSRLLKIVIPSSLPLIFTGLRISLGVGWMVLIAGELLSSSPGLGKFVWDMFNNGSSETFAQMFVVVFVVGGIGFLLDRLMIVFQRLVSFDGVITAV